MYERLWYELSYFKYWTVSNLFDWEMSQKLPVDGFECIENTSQFNKDIIKICNEKSDWWHFPKGDIWYSETLHDLHNDLLFLPERIKIKKFGKLLLYMIKVNMLFT